MRAKLPQTATSGKKPEVKLRKSTTCAHFNATDIGIGG